MSTIEVSENAVHKKGSCSTPKIKAAILNAVKELKRFFTDLQNDSTYPECTNTSGTIAACVPATAS